MNRVIMLVNEFPPLATGGAERQAERLAWFLAEHGWQVLVVTRGAPGLPPSEGRSGFEIRRVTLRGPGKVKSLAFVLGAALILWKERNSHPVLHAHLAFGPALAAAAIGRLLHSPVIVKLGNSGYYGDIQTSQRTLRGRLRLAALRHWSSVVVVLDETMRAEARQAGFSRIEKIGNGIDARRFRPCQDKNAARASLGWLPADAPVFYLLFAGRLERQKALDELLRAFAQARRSRPALHLAIVGDGAERPELERLAERLGLEAVVTFTGSQADVLPYLHAADAFVLPSQSEGISNALLEAMSCGLACIATAVGGTPEVLEGCGLLVAPGSTEELAGAIAHLSGNQRQVSQLGEMSRQRILANYDFEMVGKRYIQLYQELS